MIRKDGVRKVCPACRGSKQVEKDGKKIQCPHCRGGVASGSFVRK